MAHLLDLLLGDLLGALGALRPADRLERRGHARDLGAQGAHEEGEHGRADGVVGGARLERVDERVRDAPGTGHQLRKREG